MSAKQIIFHFIIFTIMILIINGCSEQQPQDIENRSGLPVNTASNTPSIIPQLANDYFVAVFEDQELIKIEQDDKDLRIKYCENSYLKEYQLFISMGIGSLKNPATGKPIPRHYAERAANLDARRWATYGEKWLMNDYQPPFGSLESFFNRSSRTVKQSIVGDSLFIFIATMMDID
jgi:hypothetical protein